MSTIAVNIQGEIDESFQDVLISSLRDIIDQLIAADFEDDDLSITKTQDFPTLGMTASGSITKVPEEEE